MAWSDTQVLSMAVMFLTGAGLALILDILGLVLGHLALPVARGSGRRRRQRRPPPHSRGGRALWDLGLWLIVTPFLLAATLLATHGEMRGYVFAGLGLGLAAYGLLARKAVVGAGTALRGALIRAGFHAGRKAADLVRSASARAKGRVITPLGRLAGKLLAGFGPKTRE
jgi:hypothetical protein